VIGSVDAMLIVARISGGTVIVWPVAWLVSRAASKTLRLRQLMRIKSSARAQTTGCTASRVISTMPAARNRRRGNLRVGR
jgi:hypothetical protein